MTPDTVVLEPPKAAQNRLFLRILARLSMPVVVLTIVIAIFLNVFLAGIYAILGIGVTAFLVKRRMQQNPSRLTFDAAGVRYDEGSFTVEAAWADVERIDEVLASNGKVPGLVLARSCITAARSPKIDAFARGRGLDQEIPLGTFEADWRTGEAGAAIKRFAPRLLK